LSTHISESTTIDIFVCLLGLVAGSFLNLLALRTLQERSLFSPPSSCAKCNHRLSATELIPVISYLVQRGKCNYCHQTISWQYPFVEVFTAVIFLVLVHTFGITLYTLGMVLFASTLIAICITDFREKLIPHEITYPSILAGIIFSTTIRNDLLGTLSGIGISYILFDFLAFYGLKAYLWLNKAGNYATTLHKAALPEVEISRLSKQSGKGTKFRSLDPNNARLKKCSTKHLSELGSGTEEVEVIGGGDAVLAALISAWLGLPRLAFALIIGFLVGTIMGSLYLLHEMHKQRLLRKCLKPILLTILVFILLFLALLIAIASLTQQPFQNMPYWQFLLFAIFCGTLMGVLLAGSRVSKPFPFGPALAAGAFAAIFHNPFGNPAS